MRIENISFENFGSYGAGEKTISFQDGSNSLYLIRGNNGNGKTTISKAIKYAIYGKVDGQRNSDLPNRLNGNLHTKINLVTHTGKRVFIQRKMKPNDFHVEVDGDPNIGDVAGKGNVESHLEENILQMPFKAFSNLIILSINDFKSFLKMTPKDKRDIIDRIFGLHEINEMRELVKAEWSMLKNEITSLDGSIAQLEKSINDTKKNITNIKNENRDSDRNKIDSLKSDIQKIENDIKSDKDKKTLLEEKGNLLRDGYNSIRSDISTYESKISDLAERKRLYEENDKCPTCSSDLHSDYHKDLFSEYTKDQKDLEVLVSKAQEKLKDLKSKLEKCDTYIKTISKRISDYQLSIRTNKSKIETLKKSNNKDKRIEDMENLVSKFEGEWKEQLAKLEEYHKKYDYYSILKDEILSDDGVKNMAIKSIVPTLNKNIRKYVSELHFPFDLSFDEKFDCSVSQLGLNVHPSTLSGGERKIADLIIVLSIIHVIRLKFPTLNVIFLDEIFSSIDKHNLPRMLSLFRDLTKELNINLMVISHKSELAVTDFDKVVNVTKSGNYSDFSVNTVR